jgi:hypothetical protein
LTGKKVKYKLNILNFYKSSSVGNYEHHTTGSLDLTTGQQRFSSS